MRKEGALRRPQFQIGNMTSPLGKVIGKCGKMQPDRSIVVSPMNEACSGHHRSIIWSLLPVLLGWEGIWRSPHLSRVLKDKRLELARSSEKRREAEKGSSIKYVGKPQWKKNLGHIGNTITLLIN